MAGPAYIWDEWRFEPTECRLMRNDATVPMPAKTLDLLATLLRRAPRLVTKEEILTAVWPDAAVEEGNIAFHVAALRKVLDTGDGPSVIENVRGRGYRFVHDVAILQLPLTDAVQQRIVQPPPVARHQARRRALWPALAVAGLLVVALVMTAVMRGRPAEWSVVVMPFTVVDSDEGAEFVPGLAQYIVLELEKSGIRAQARTGGLRGEQPRDTAMRLGADAALMGTLRQTPAGWQVAVELARSSDGRREWTWVFEVATDANRPAGAGPDDVRSRLQGTIGGRIAAGLQHRLAAGDD
ncbi:MAG: winged helix-turn-helix domain-containing protein [Acidobacteriota bacterium]|nr:winged helix-turn-helix domain-containing protein [Acidobacteriota bacterium]